MKPHGLKRANCRRRSHILVILLWMSASAIPVSSWYAQAQTLSTAFADFTTVPVGSWPESVAIGDLNDDGRNDVVLGTSSFGTSTNNRSILVFYQKVGGELASPVSYSANGDANSIAIADFTGDGRSDIAVGRESAGIRVFTQGSTGGFDVFTDYPTANANWICSADFNNDGRKDVAGIGWSSQQVDVFTQTAGGILGFAGQSSANYAGWNDIEAGDVNNDGRSDIIVMSGQGFASPNISILMQTNGGFAEAVPYDLGGNELTKGLGVGDLNGDGRSDIVVSFGGNRPNSKLSVFEQQGDGTLLRGATMDSYDIPESVVVSDIDLDGRMDILTVHGGWNRLGVYFQISPGTFTSETLFTIPYASHYNPHGLAVGDINGDRMPDVIIADYNNGLVVLTNRLPPPALPIPQLSNPWVSGGTATFWLNGPAGRNFLIEASSDLINWVRLMTNVVPSTGWVILADPVPVGALRRFYRATPHSGGPGSFNDFFNDRITIPTSGGTVSGSSAGATKEPGEPDHGGTPGGTSVWWTWTAPSTGIATISTDLSSFDTTLAVYQGSAVGSLTLTAQDDDGGEGTRSRVIFNAVAGTEYQIAVDGYGGESGDINLTVKPGLLNDDFKDRLWIHLIGSSDVVVGNNVRAGREEGEAELDPDAGGASVWWRWVAPTSGNVTISTAGSAFDTILAAFVGSPGTILDQIAINDDFGGSSTSQISFFASGGTEYEIAVDGYGIARGMIRLTVQQ